MGQIEDFKSLLAQLDIKPANKWVGLADTLASGIGSTVARGIGNDLTADDIMQQASVRDAQRGAQNNAFRGLLAKQFLPQGTDPTTQMRNYQFYKQGIGPDDEDGPIPFLKFLQQGGSGRPDPAAALYPLIMPMLMNTFKNMDPNKSGKGKVGTPNNASSGAAPIATPKSIGPKIGYK